MDEYRTNAEQLIDFIKESPTSFHACKNLIRELKAAGFSELSENEHWNLSPEGKYYVQRNHSALIGFTLPGTETGKKALAPFHIIASHSDSPSLKIKENPEIEAEKAYIKLNIEKYGGALLSPWFDRPLSIAGRVIVKENGKLIEKLVDIKRDLLMIPSLAIHMNREANKGVELSVQKHLLPLYGMKNDTKTSNRTEDSHNADTSQEPAPVLRFAQQLLFDQAACIEDLSEYPCPGALPKEAGSGDGNSSGSLPLILSHDLFVYNRMEGTVWGSSGEFISAPRLDDLECAYASVRGIMTGTTSRYINVCCVLDNEEVGSSTKQGAAAGFLKDTLRRIVLSQGGSEEDYMILLADSFMISADNAHAVHPNYPEKADPVNRPLPGKGIVIKYSANQKYCTDGISSAYFKELCDLAHVPCQIFVNHSDEAGGSTLGNISNTQAAMNTVDIGLAQLAMHSPYETAGVSDLTYLIRAAEVFYSQQ